MEKEMKEENGRDDEEEIVCSYMPQKEQKKEKVKQEREKQEDGDGDDEEERVDCREVLATAGGFSPPPLLALPAYNTLHSLTTDYQSEGGWAQKKNQELKLCATSKLN